MYKNSYIGSALILHPVLYPISGNSQAQMLQKTAEENLNSRHGITSFFWSLAALNNQWQSALWKYAILHLVPLFYFLIGL